MHYKNNEAFHFRLAIVHIRGKSTKTKTVKAYRIEINWNDAKKKLANLLLEKIKLENEKSHYVGVFVICNE